MKNLTIESSPMYIRNLVAISIAVLFPTMSMSATEFNLDTSNNHCSAFEESKYQHAKSIFNSAGTDNQEIKILLMEFNDYRQKGAATSRLLEKNKHLETHEPEYWQQEQENLRSELQQDWDNLLGKLASILKIDKSEVSQFVSCI